VNERPAPRIVCAAVKLKLGLIVCGPRHFDMTMRDNLRQLRLTVKDSVQGFVDQFGDFYTREAAWEIAERNGQILRDLSCGKGVLYSEHLY
jgi:hypothetical protein